MELDTVAKHLRAFYRLTWTTAADDALLQVGDAQDDIAYTFLTIGSRNAQRWLLNCGWVGWRKRSPALTFSGDDATDGGRRTSVPSDFLRAYTVRDDHGRYSALVEPDGQRWAAEIAAPEASYREGDYYYFRHGTAGEELWLARKAVPPTTLYLDYHYLHPAWSGAVTIDFPLEQRYLIVAEAADAAKEEGWLPGGPELEAKIGRRVAQARQAAASFARRSRRPRELLGPPRFGNR